MEIYWNLRHSKQPLFCFSFNSQVKSFYLEEGFASMIDSGTGSNLADAAEQ